MIIAIVAIVVILWKIATSTVAYKLLDFNNKYESKRDVDVEELKWNSAWNDIERFRNELKKLRNDKKIHVYDMTFSNYMIAWILKEYGYSIDDLKNSTKDKGRKKWFGQIYNCYNIFVGHKDIQQYDDLYSGKWINDFKLSVKNNARTCDKAKTDLGLARKEEQKTGVRELVEMIVIFFVIVISCQFESNIPSGIAILIAVIYFAFKMPETVRFFKERRDCINK